MYISYNTTGEIVAMSEIEINVEGAKNIKINKDIDPRSYKVVNDELVKRESDLQTITVDKIEPLSEDLIFLNATDYKVTKYRDQLDLGAATDLTEDEFKILLQQRQDARDRIKASKQG